MTSDPQPGCVRRKLLLVDDHAGFRRTVRDFLPAEAREVIECARGDEALEACVVHDPACVLMDLEMPGLDGLRATRALRDRFPQVRVVIVTQHDSPELREAARAAGALAYVPKDRLSDLARVIKDVLSESSSPRKPASPS